MNETTQPTGQLVIKTLAMPRDTNANGDIFGGWLVSQMDIGAGIFAKYRAHGRVVTVAINDMVFKRPVQVGDIVACYAEMLKIGRTSMTIQIHVWTYARDDGQANHVAEGSFTFVAIDEKGKPRLVC